jgi:hypothetical protein
MRLGVPVALQAKAVTDRSNESDFLSEFRDAGLTWAAYAAFAGSASFASFMILAWAWEPSTAGALLCRGGLATGLGLAGFGLWNRTSFCRQHYVAFIASVSAGTLVGTLLLIALRGDAQHEGAVQASPAIMFGLFLHYAFLRLPLKVSATIGWSVAAAASISGTISTAGSTAISTTRGCWTRRSHSGNCVADHGSIHRWRLRSPWRTSRSTFVSPCPE